MRIEEALEIIKEHQDSAPVEVIPIAYDLGMKVYYVNWPDNASGKVALDEKYGGKSGYAIFVNRNHHSHRRRFTIAHEIAHFVLHRNLIGEGIFDDGLYRSGLPSKVEYAANRMAADILMPWHLINAAMDRGITNPTALALHFKVSESAMSIRLGIPAEA
jgi:Zn-dependent peptidase ImmA (M78 family)